jgi:hypothetical protein
VVRQRQPKKVRGKASCSVCDNIMDEWNSNAAPIYTLISMSENWSG